MKERVLLAIMGDHPMEYPGGNTRRDFINLQASTHRADVNLYVIPDLVPTVGATDAYNPAWGPKHRGIHAMRCHAVEKARAEGYDYLFIVENDVALAPDTIDRLILRRKDHIVPRHEFPDGPIFRCHVFQPVFPEHATGLHRIDWCGYPATLYRIQAFRGIEPMFVGGGEGFDYGRWHEAGIETWMDLDVEAINLRLPGPLQVLLSVPGALLHHMKKNSLGQKVLCDGSTYEYRSRGKLDGVEIFHLACHGCEWSIDYIPPPDYRSKALFVGEVLGRGMAGARRG